MQCQNNKRSFKVSYVMVIESTSHKNLERHLHEVFDMCRGDGEWFKLTDSELEWIRETYRDSIVPIRETD